MEPCAERYCNTKVILMTTFANLIASQHQFEVNGGERIGALLWWDLNGCHISHPDLLDQAEDYGVPERYLPLEITPINAFKRAFRKVEQALPTGLMLRKITQQSEARLNWVGVVEESVDASAKDLDYATLTKLTFDRETGVFSVVTTDPREIKAKFEYWYDHCKCHTTDDIRRILQSFNREASVSLRDSGGVYFLTNSHQSTLDGIANLIHAISPGNKVYQLPLFTSPTTQSTLNQVVAHNLEAEIKRLKEDINGLVELESTRESTLQKRLPELELIRARVRTFSDVLSFQAEELYEKLGEAETRLRAELTLNSPPQPVSPQPLPQSPQPFSLKAFDTEIGF